jgi:hypothetical protein
MLDWLTTTMPVFGQDSAYKTTQESDMGEYAELAEDRRLVRAG